MKTSEVHRIRPAGRHILTIGRDLIQDHYAAIVELVKNAYDADSPDVNIEFEAVKGSGYSIRIIDHGHGMSKDTIVTKWMIPSTDDKVSRRVSPGGRVMQGRKGLGRFAASVLGNDLFVETVTPIGQKTTVLVEWEKFENAEFLENVEILIESEESTEPQGTRLTINGDSLKFADWTSEQFNKLRYELKKLISPIEVASTESKVSDGFQIRLSILGFLEEDIILQEIKPFPIFDLFDYRISGIVEANGRGILTYSSQKVRNLPTEEIRFDIGTPTRCGSLGFDIRVYDREKESIEGLITRGLKDERGDYLGGMQARKLLDEYNGIGVFRNGFRIRPLGDPDFDWLKLNQKRIQNPSLCIGSNQVIGFVTIESEEKSGLFEKSARDGLKENHAFDQLKSIAGKVIDRLQTLRFEYRQKAGLSRPAMKIERELQKLFAFDDLKRDVRERLKNRGVAQGTAEEVISIISEEEKVKSKMVQDIQKSVAIYQGQATVGKIINVILHEGRRPLNYFKNQIPNLDFWLKQFRNSQKPDNLDQFMSIAEGVGQNAEVFVELFSTLDPLATSERPPKTPLPLKKSIEESVRVLAKEVRDSAITINVVGPDDFFFLTWLQDIHSIFTNLADNSIYWMRQKITAKPAITIHIEVQDDILQFIDYRDSGPGIDAKLIQSGIIFEPEFSTKPGGMGRGLGLAIAGEASARNGLELRALESDGGAYFRLQPTVKITNEKIKTVSS